MNFTIHTVESAPVGSKPNLESSLRAWRMIPNLYGVMAESPVALQAYQELHHLFAQSSLTAEERSVVWLTVSVANECHYCVPAHTAIAYSDGLERSLIDALRAGNPLSDPKLEALRQFTLALVTKNGKVSEEEQSTFLAAGYEVRHALDVLVGIAQKTLSNFVNHLADTPLDSFAKKFAWSSASNRSVEALCDCK
jgi:AhpD family alkylhydroperoxidase